MAPYNMGGRRMQQSTDTPSQASDAAQPAAATTANSGISSIPRYPPSQIIRPVNHTPRTSRASSVSSTEHTGSPAVPSAVSNQTTGSASRLSMLPRPNSARRLSSTSPVSSVAPQTTPRPVPSSLSSPDINKPFAVHTGHPVAPANPANKPRNVLRRKAATIGKHADKSQPQTLGLVIPPTSPSKEVTAPSTPTFTESQPPRPSTSPQAQSEENEQNVVGPRKTHPEELASLRTTVDTQNLPPPPTPFFGSASSPSTRYSESPGVWSRTSTSTTLSSCSPGIVQSAKIGRLRQPSPSQTRLPVLSPPTSHTSPQSDREELRTPNSALSGKPSPPDQKPQTPKLKASKIRGPPRSPPPRKSSVNFSPSKTSDIDVEKARKEVEEAEKALLESTVASSATTADIRRRPRRPSRDGTHLLELETPPVIQSNLPYIRSTGHTRRESAEKIMAAGLPRPAPGQAATTSVDSLLSSSISRTTSREGDSPVMSQKSPPTKESPREKPAPKKTATPKRFGLFPKKSKPDVDENASDQVRPHRKGPAAGTGYEGYGKYSQRGRKPSVGNSSGTRTRSTSTTRSAAPSSKGSMFSRPDLELDDFLMSRLEPVIISGGGMGGAALSRTQSEQSMSSVSVASTSNLPCPTPTTSTPQSTDSLATSTGTFSEPGPVNETAKGLGLMHVKSLDQPPAADQPRPPKSRMPLPKGKRHKIFTSSEATKTQSSLSSHDSSFAQSKDPARPTADQAEQRSGQDEKQSKKGKPFKWKLFQRIRGHDQKGSVSAAPVSHTAQLHAAISPVVNSRPVAHYALVDADSDSLDEILHKVEESPPTEDEEDSLKPVEVPAGLNIRKKQQSILLPSLPKLHGEFQRDDHPAPKTALFNPNVIAPESEPSQEGRRPRRLASVGRIPQVAARRDRQHRPTMQSFSRPFSACDSPNLTAPSSEAPFQSALNELQQWVAQKDIPFSQQFSAPEQSSALDFLAGPYSNNEFIHFSPSKDSASSSSSGALAAVTALPPEPGSTPTEDEVWNEYDDLIDYALSPEEPNPDTPGDGGKFELATMASKTLQDELNNLNPLQRAPQMSAEPSSSSSHLREQQSTFLHSLAAVPPTKASSRSHRRAMPGSSERDWDDVTRTNMRSASLMTSRWLSFGRVLFSPAHNHVKAGAQGRILVIDGLGNDDWSFYCSLTYPDATVYALSGRSASAAIPHPAAWQPPTNHHTVYYADLHNSLPFPKDYFTVAVLRFPAECSEEVQNNIVQECKRVLRSGGYLEMSLLDRDMVNMGVRTRKAVRRLKEMTYLADSSISLKPISDNIQRLIGAQGFDNLRRCMVRIPVAGMVLQSSDSTSSSNRSATVTTTPPFSLPTISTTETGTHAKSQSDDTNVSLGDLLSDPSPSPSNDEKIAKIVARVGRWWYTKCYEVTVLPDAGDADSMWNDGKLLRECQKDGTGFRMLIAYAQKPSEVKRRTASV